MQKRKHTKKQLNTGFTLVEMLVSIALFAVVVTITFGTIVTIIDVNRKSQTLTLVMNNLNFTLESITRTIKTSRSITSYGGELHFENQDGKYVAYREESGQILKCVKDTANCSFISLSSVDDDYVPITATDVQIQDFLLNKWDSGDSGQPRVFLIVSGVAAITEKISSEFSIQTTVSIRALDV
jgi:prepilin-type N-terminal cleavage/methylation domain-containing protein